MKRRFEDLYGALKDIACHINLFPFISDGENNTILGYCFDVFTTEILPQSTSMPKSGTVMGLEVSVVALAPATTDSMLLSAMLLVDDSDRLFCLNITKANIVKIAAPATRTKIQLNCISKAFLCFILSPCAYQSVVSLSFQF